MCKPTHNSTSSLKVPSNSDEIFCTIVVPTFREKRFKETFDKKDIKSSADLDQLKKDDPFMYYSLPEVKEAAMKGKDVDFSVLGAAADGASSLSSVVERRSAISFESWDLDFNLLFDENEISRTYTDAPSREGRRDSFFVSFLRDLTNAS